MEEKNIAVSKEIAEFAKVLNDAKKDAQIYHDTSIAITNFIFGLKAALSIDNITRKPIN